VVDLTEDLSWGPITPADFADRAVWFDLNLPWADGRWDWVEEAETLFSSRLAQDSEHLLWVAPHNARELSGLHWYLDRVSDLNVSMIMVGRRALVGEPARKIQGLGELHPKHFGHLLRHSPREHYDPKGFPATRWSELARDATSLRVAQDAQLINVKEDYFDEAILAEITTTWRKGYRVMAGAMIGLWEEGHDTSDAFWLWRLRELSMRGVIETNREVLYEHALHDPLMVRKPG